MCEKNPHSMKVKKKKKKSNSVLARIHETLVVGILCPVRTILYIKLMPLNILTQNFYVGIFMKSNLYCVHIYKKYIKVKTLTNVYTNMEI